MERKKYPITVRRHKNQCTHNHTSSNTTVSLFKWLNTTPTHTPTLGLLVSVFTQLNPDFCPSCTWHMWLHLLGYCKTDTATLTPTTIFTSCQREDEVIWTNKAHWFTTMRMFAFGVLGVCVVFMLPVKKLSRKIEDVCSEDSESVKGEFHHFFPQSSHTAELS